jgi:SulP family sulfate permease
MAFSRGDLVAGLSVTLIAIPQALAYAELAGMPAYTGLYALALPSIVAAYFVSSPYLQTGPGALTALLTLGVLSQFADPGSSSYMGLAALLALVVGAVRVLIGVVRFGSIAYLMSQPMLMGFTSAAAILILLSQLPTALGVQPALSGVVPGAFWALTHPAAWEPSALGLSIMTMAVVFWGRRLHPLFPGVLIAVGLGIGYSHVMGYHGAMVGDIPAGWPRPRLDLPWSALPSLLIGGGVIALVGFAEASSIARTYATQDRLPWDANREFISQGMANLTAGLFGGFPVGGSFARSSINRLSGATSGWSGAVMGLTVLAFMPFTGVLSVLPRAILGAIVISAVSSLIRLKQLLDLRQYSRPQAYIAQLIFVLTLVLAPRIDIAVIIGVALAIAHHLRREQRLVFQHWTDATGLHVKPQGVLWFGSSYSVETVLTNLLAQYPEVKDVKLHLGGLGRIDLSAAMMLKQFLEDAHRAGIKVELLEVPPMAKSWVERVWYDVIDT